MNQTYALHEILELHEIAAFKTLCLTKAKTMQKLVSDEGMNNILEYLTGLNTMTDQVIATDLLISAKSGVRSYAMAITETATPEIKAALTKQLDEAILTHEQILSYMMQKGYHHPYQVNEQIQLDLQNIQTALSINS